MILKPLELKDLQIVREWRRDITETLRTSFFLNRKMQEEFYEEVLSNRYGNTRYWGFWEHKAIFPDPDFPIGKYENTFIGMGGLENIEIDNRRAEISLLINPNHRGKGFGKKCVDEILNQGFYYINLEYIWGECFECANYQFWEKMIQDHGAESQWLPARKYWGGKYWNSLYFTFKRGGNDTIL